MSCNRYEKDEKKLDDLCARAFKLGARRNPYSKSFSEWIFPGNTHVFEWSDGFERIITRLENEIS